MIRKLGLALSTAMLASALGSAAHAANPPLPGLVNLNFAQTQNAPKGTFQYVNPTGWTGGSGLIFIDSTSIPNADAAGSVYLQTYGDPTGAVTGNYVEADGNPQYESGFNYQVSGLTIGQTYSLSFYQGASQQTGFATAQATTNQWIVSLGLNGLSLGNGPCAPDSIDPTYGSVEHYCNTDPGASVVASPLMHIPPGGTVGWDYVSVNLKADATSELLSFLAWGDNGSTVNLPPIAFLAGVDSPPGLGSGAPEPEAWALMVIGFMGLGGALRAERARRRTAVLQA